MKRHLLLPVLGVLAASNVACLEIEQSIVLKKNLSGTTDLSMKLDMEPMAYIMAFMQKAMMGGGPEAEPSAAEIKAAKQQFLATQGKEFEDKFTAPKKEIMAKLPEGVQLKKYKTHKNGMKLSTDARLAFKHIRLMNNVELEKEGGRGGDGPMSALQFVDNGSTFTIRTTFDNPAQSKAGMGPAGGADPDFDSMPGKAGQRLKKAMKRIGFKVSIDAPFKVVEHNATSVKGSRLTWHFDYTMLKKLGQGEKAEVMVTYRK